MRAIYILGVAPDNLEEHTYIKRNGLERHSEYFYLKSFDRERRRAQIKFRWGFACSQKVYDE